MTRLDGTWRGCVTADTDARWKGCDWEGREERCVERERERERERGALVGDAARIWLRKRTQPQRRGPIQQSTFLPPTMLASIRPTMFASRSTMSLLRASATSRAATVSRAAPAVSNRTDRFSCRADREGTPRRQEVPDRVRMLSSKLDGHLYVVPY